MKSPRTAYGKLIASFDHTPLSAFPAYRDLRQALSDLGNQITESGTPVKVTDFLTALRDMGLTAPFGDCCARCSAASGMFWPHAAERNGDVITGSYRCGQGHEWTCHYNVDMPGVL